MFWLFRDWVKRSSMPVWSHYKSVMQSGKRICRFCAAKSKKPLKSPGLPPRELIKCMQRATSVGPGRSSGLHRAGKDHHALIPPAYCLQGKKGKCVNNTDQHNNKMCKQYTDQHNNRNKGGGAPREPKINSGPVPETFLGEKWSKLDFWWLDRNPPDTHGLRKGILERHSKDYLENSKHFDVLENQRSDRTFVGYIEYRCGVFPN